MGTLSKPQIEAAQEFVDLTIAALKTERGVHAETAVAAASRMAGTFLLRSFGLPLDGITPGQPIFSDFANERGPQLIGLLGSVLAQLGVKVDGGQLGRDAGPDHAPLQGFLETQKLLEPKFQEVRERLGLSPEEAAQSAAAATGLLIQKCASVLDTDVAFGIAAYGFVEGSKTAPGPTVPSA